MIFLRGLAVIWIRFSQSFMASVHARSNITDVFVSAFTNRQVKPVAQGRQNVLPHQFFVLQVSPQSVLT